MILTIAKEFYSKARAIARLENKNFGITYVATKRLPLSCIKQMPEEEQVRADRIKETTLQKIIRSIKDCLNYELERVVVKRVKKRNGKYEYVLFDGHHRFTAFSQLGYTDIVVDVIHVPETLDDFKIKIYKCILNKDYPKNGNDLDDIVKTCKSEIKKRFPKESKVSSVNKKEVKKVFKDFIKDSEILFDNKERKYIEDQLFKIFSSGKDALKEGDIVTWLSIKGKVKDLSDPSLVQNLMMGRIKGHPIKIGYGGLTHLEDRDCYLFNPVHICSTKDHIKQNLWEMEHYMFTSRYNEKKIPPALFAFWVPDHNGDLDKLEEKREELQKYFFDLRDELAEAIVKKCEYFLGKEYSEKERQQIKHTFKRCTGNIGCIPQLDSEKEFVTSKGNDYVYPYGIEDFHYA